ncbi:MAG: hypothetical protein V1926_06175 [Candidatus Peregrinibacteria bacterium]
MSTEHPDHPSFIDVPASERMYALEAILQRMRQESLSPVEEFAMQKAIALFLLGERVSWGILQSHVFQAARLELPDIEIAENIVDKAMNSLATKGLLHFEDDIGNQTIKVRIGAIMTRGREQECAVFVRSLYHFEYDSRNPKSGRDQS